MADCTITFDIGHGGDERATSGFFALRRIAEGLNGTIFVLTSWKRYNITSPPRTLTLPQGVLYEVTEKIPNGKHRRFQVPPYATFNYGDLEWLDKVPGSSGAYVHIASYTTSYDGEEPPGLSPGDIWFVDNVSLPTHGDLMIVNS